MKVLFATTLATFFALLACNNTATNLRSFVPGTYIRFSEHEFGVEYDTVTISALTDSKSHYRIMRKWRYERILDGQVLEPEYKRSITSGFLNDSQQIIKEAESGLVYSFDIEQKLLFIGSTKYQKL